MFARWSPLIAFVVALTSLLGGNAAAAPALPESMAAVGDSITRAYNTGPIAYTDYPPNSWSTGTSVTVNSHNVRIFGATGGPAFNDAVSGAKMADLAGQVTTVNSQQVGYVTVLIGGNDVCTSSEATMTPVQTFRSQFKTAMTSLSTGSPNTLIYVVSIPDVYHLWSIFHTDATARFFWSTFQICQSMLANAGSTSATDEARRNRVRQRNIHFNAQLRTICAQTPNCLFDGNAVFNTKFVTSDVSTRDFFHPSLRGQTRLACVSWAAGYWGDPAQLPFC
jgi:hypothetical protein